MLQPFHPTRPVASLFWGVMANKYKPAMTGWQASEVEEGAREKHQSGVVRGMKRASFVCCVAVKRRELWELGELGMDSRYHTLSIRATGYLTVLGDQGCPCGYLHILEHRQLPRASKDLFRSHYALADDTL